MKKVLLGIILFIIININVYAFTGNYNYEVKSLSKDENGNITIKGWAIPNAGVNDGKSPQVNQNLGSGYKSGKCVTANKNNYYTYTLYMVPLNDNKKPIVNSKVEVGSMKGSGTSLTEVMCYKYGSSCGASRSSCYENVGWKFNFNEKDYLNDDFKNGYVLRLKITPSGAPKKTVEFNLVVYKDRITGFGSDYEYKNNGNVKNLRVTVIAYDGYQRNCNNNGCFRKNNSKFQHGVTYKVSGFKNYGGQTYYKIGDALYIPASWVAPPEADLLIIQSGPKTVKSCNDNSTSQIANTKNVSACNGNVAFEGENYNTCTVDEYSYYTRKCYEKDYKVNFNINEINDNSKSFNYQDGITASVNINTNFSCSYTFDVEKFKEDYNNVLYNLSYYKEGAPEWFENNGIKANLDTILENYKKQTDNTTSWESGYDFKKLNATLKLDNNELSKLELKDENLKHTDSKGNVNGNNYCQVNEKKAIAFNDGSKKDIYTEVTCMEGYSAKLELPRVCLNMQTGKMESCISNATNQIEGGNKFYLEDNQSGELSLEINNLGYDGNWKANLTGCKVSNIKKEVIFRQIDLKDPFLKNYGNEREIGANYLNNKFDFSKIIHEDTWNQQQEYDYFMSKTNIANIRKDTAEDRPSSYLGRDCNFINNEYQCRFTRNQASDGSNNSKKWFTNTQGLKLNQ